MQVTNFNIPAHTADFRCNNHDAYKNGVNVNTELSYDNGGILLDTDIFDSGTELAQCKHFVWFRDDSASDNDMVANLAQAKTV